MNNKLPNYGAFKMCVKIPKSKNFPAMAVTQLLNDIKKLCENKGFAIDRIEAELIKHQEKESVK